jgi:ATP-binding cassette, subfamily C, bacterial CydD
MTPHQKPIDPAICMLRRISSSISSPLKAAAVLSVCASLLIIPQAFLAGSSIGAFAAGEGWDHNSLIWAALGWFLLGLLRLAADLAAGRIAFRAAQRAIAGLRVRLLDLRLYAAAYGGETESSASAAALMAEKSELLSPYLSRYYLARVKTMATPVAVLLVTGSLSWAVMLILLVSGPLIPLFMALIGFRARDVSERQLAEISSLNALLLERLNALGDIKLLDGRAEMIAQFSGAAEALKRRTMAVLKIAFLSSTVLELFAALGVALVAVYVGFSLLGVFSFGAWGHTLSVGQGVSLLLLAPEFFAPLRELAAGWHDRAAALALAGELAAVEAVPVAKMLGRGARASALKGPLLLEFRSVIDHPLAGNVISFPDFRLEEGQRLAVTGRSGAGKSLFLSLAAGLRRPHAGRILVHGALLDDDVADNWRATIAWIPQRPHFFQASLRANLVGAANFDRERLEASLETVGMRGVVERLPRGLDTVMVETGALMSGGEARRLMIARAIYARARLVLADEPTADLDAANADKVADALLSLDGAALLIGTHDRRLIARMSGEIRIEATP